MIPCGIQIDYPDPLDEFLEKNEELRKHNLLMTASRLDWGFEGCSQRTEHFEYTCTKCGAFFCIEPIQWPFIGDYIISAGEYDCFCELGYLNHRPLQGIPECCTGEK